MDWYNRSLAAFQSDLLDRVDAEQLLDKLVKIKILEIVKERYRVTNLGRVAAVLYFSPYSIANWYFNFNRIFSDENGTDDYAISWALSNIQDYMEGFIPGEAKDSVAEYKRKCNLISLDSKNDGVGWMGFCYHCCLTYSDAISSAYKRNIKFDFERIVSALEMIDSRYAFWNKDSYWQKLEMRVRYEITWEQTQLCKLRKIGGQFARKLYDAGVQKISDFRKSRHTDTIKSILGPNRYNSVMRENGLEITDYS